MNRKNITVAVDGPAGSGKSSVCRDVAVMRHLRYVDSGALYRAITWHCLRGRRSLQGGMDFSFEPGDLDLRQEFHENGKCSTFVNGQDVSLLIRDEIIAGNIGVVSDTVSVRDFVNSLLRRWAESESVIMDGRDIGTVVFPNASVKIYLDASVDLRAERRIKEYREMGKNVDENAIKKQIIQRDNEDFSRSYGALSRAEDAIYCDTSFMTRQEVVAYIIDIIERVQKGRLTAESDGR
jgi:cytidylate kinase